MMELWLTVNGKTLLHGDVLMWLMKTLLTSRCINQRGAGHITSARLRCSHCLNIQIKHFLLG
ncbi:hypothetical protein FPG81_19950 [Escherichia coli]|nr:hypothetical protein [Escherichia coli]